MSLAFDNICLFKLISLLERIFEEQGVVFTGLAKSHGSHFIASKFDRIYLKSEVLWWNIIPPWETVPLGSCISHELKQRSSSSLTPI